jgi:predicted amidohydrolase
MISRIFVLVGIVAIALAARGETAKTIRVAAVQAKNRSINFHVPAEEALAAAEENLGELESIVAKAAEKRIEALVFPEDTMCLLNWSVGNETAAKELLLKAVKSMLARMGGAAARHNMYLVVCSDFVESDGGLYNTAFFIGRDGKEIGRYHKVCPVYHELSRKRGTSFPVFPTKDLGTVGMLICYDLVIPETARAIALGGADIILYPTMGTAAIGDDDIGVQALRVRAVENFVYLVVAHRGAGAMIISPQGKILSQAEGPDGFAIADIDPFGGREGGDAMNFQHDMRARLFRERNPEAFGILTDPNPPALKKVPIDLTPEESSRIASKALSTGEEDFKKASSLKGAEAIAAYKAMQKEYRGSWIDRVSAERIAKLEAENPTLSAAGQKGIAAKYRNDVGIENDSRVLFADNFESGDLKKWDEKRATIAIVEEKPNSGKYCVHIPMHRGRDHGGDAIKWFMPGADQIYARIYVKFSADYQYNHHFLWLGANQRTNKWSAFGKAGLKPNGTYYSTGMEPWFAWGKNPSPGEINFYSYFLDMEPDPKMPGKYWGNSFFPPGPDRGKAAGPNRVIPPLDKWQCWEFMIQANTAPEKADGKQAMWVDGNLIGEFTGIRWRNDMDLKVNCFWMEHYGYDEGDPTKQYWKDSQAVWFDDLVVAREYIGPIERQ